MFTCYATREHKFKYRGLTIGTVYKDEQEKKKKLNKNCVDVRSTSM